MINFKQLKHEVSIRDVLAFYGATVKDFEGKELDGYQWVAACPICQAPDAIKAKENGAWKCFSCNESGNIFDLVGQKERFLTDDGKINVRKAAEFVVEKIKDDHRQPVKVLEVTVDNKCIKEYEYREIARIVITIGIEQ